MKMIYHPEGNKVIWGINCKTLVIEEGDLPGYLKDGWYESPLDFKKVAAKKPQKRGVKDE